MAMKIRRDTTANFASANTIPAEGQPVFDKTTKALKVGDGVNTVAALPIPIPAGGIAVAHLSGGAIASTAEAQAGSATDKLMTPQMTAAAIAALAPSSAVTPTSQSFAPVAGVQAVKFDGYRTMGEVYMSAQSGNVTFNIDTTGSVDGGSNRVILIGDGNVHQALIAAGLNLLGVVDIDPTNGQVNNIIFERIGSRYYYGVTPGPLLDLTKPTLLSAAVLAAAPNVVVMTWSEPLAATMPPASAFTVGSSTVSSVAVGSTSSEVNLTLAAAWANGQTGNVGYTKPGSGNVIKDLASPANEANTVTGVAITNNVPAVVGISDNFNRADASVPGGPWTVLAGTGSINSNKAGNNGSGGPADMVANLGHADTVLSAKVTIGTGGYPWLHFRGDGTAANRLEIYFNAGGTFDFGKKIAGAYTSLANASHGLAVGVESAIVLTLSGSSVSMTVNGVSKLSTTTTQWQTQTYVGYAPSVPDDRFDDFNAT